MRHARGITDEHFKNQLKKGSLFLFFYLYLKGLPERIMTISKG